MNKKGLSGVVAIVLIVLLGVGAVALAWAFILPIFGGASGVSTDVELRSISFDIIARSVVIDSDNNVSYILAEFPPGSQRIPVKKGQLLGYQGRWRNRDIWVHLGFTVIEPLEDGSSPPYLPEIWYKNAPVLASKTTIRCLSLFTPPVSTTKTLLPSGLTAKPAGRLNCVLSPIDRKY